MYEWAPLTWLLPTPGSTGDVLVVQQPLDLAKLRTELQGLLARGIQSLAVVLLHSYA